MPLYASAWALMPAATPSPCAFSAAPSDSPFSRVASASAVAFALMPSASFWAEYSAASDSFLALDTGGLGLLRALVEVGFRRLLGGIAVGLGLLLHGRVQFRALTSAWRSASLDLLGLRGDLGLLLGNIELALLLGRHGGLHHIGLGLRLVGLLLEVGLLQVELVLADGDLLGRPNLRQLGTPS